MNRKYFDARNHEMITEKRCQIKEISSDTFTGIISLISIDNVVKPQVLNYGGYDITIYDKGMEWLRMLPKNADYSMTAMFNADGEIVLWNINIIKGYAYDENGDFYFNDLFVDVIALPNGVIRIKDMDELQSGLTSGEIGAELFHEAVNAKDEVVNEVLKDIEAVKELTLKLRGEFN